MKNRSKFMWLLVGLMVAALGIIFGGVTRSTLAGNDWSADRPVIRPPRFETAYLTQMAPPAGPPAPPPATRRTSFPGVREAAKFHPRDPGEWQGMLVDVTMQQVCDSSARCGLAMACRDGHCGPCLADSDCSAGEGCVLDHCLRRDAIACRSVSDCDPGELCILTNYTPRGRGNADMKAICFSPEGGRMQRPEDSMPKQGDWKQRLPEMSQVKLLELLKSETE